MKRFVSIIIVAILFFAACTKENFEPPKSKENLKMAKTKAQNLGKFQKDLTIYDEKKENNVVLRLWSNEKSILDQWKEADFEIMVILKNESFDNAYERKYHISFDYENELGEEIQKDEIFEKVTEPLISVMIIEKNMQKGVENIALTILNNGSGAKWDYPQALYSSELQRKRTATIRGYKWLWRAYYGVDIKENQNAAWTTLVAQWQQIKSGETHTPYSDCYQMRVWRKYNNSGAITVAFDD